MVYIHFVVHGFVTILYIALFVHCSKYVALCTEMIP